MTSVREQPFEISRFSGLNIRDTPGRIKDSELVECYNFDLGIGGELIKRTGLKGLGSAASLGANSITLIGYFQTNTYNQIIARSGDNLYYSTDGGIVWTLIAGGPWGSVDYGVQYVDKFYFVRRNAVMLEWNGAVMSAITGSPMGSHVFAYKDRLFVVNTYATGSLNSRLYFSKIADFSATGWPSTNFIDISPGDSDFCISTIQLQDTLVVFKTRSTWLLYVAGDPSLWTLRNSSPEIGCVSRYTPRDIEGQVYFVGPRGVYRTDGSSFIEISKEIQDNFSSQVISTAEVNKTFAGWWNDKYIVFVSLINQSVTWGSLEFSTWDSLSALTWNALTGAYYKCFVYFIRADGWTQWEPAVGVAPFGFLEINQPSNHRGLLTGSRNLDGKVYRYGDVIYQDDSLNYTCRLKTKEFDLGTPSKAKKGKLIVAEINSSGNHEFSNVVGGLPKASQFITCKLGRVEYKLKGPHYFRIWSGALQATHENPITFYGFSMYLAARTTVIKSGV